MATITSFKKFTFSSSQRLWIFFVISTKMLLMGRRWRRGETRFHVRRTFINPDHSFSLRIGLLVVLYHHVVWWWRIIKRIVCVFAYQIVKLRRIVIISFRALSVIFCSGYYRSCSIIVYACWRTVAVIIVVTTVSPWRRWGNGFFRSSLIAGRQQILFCGRTIRRIMWMFFIESVVVLFSPIIIVIKYCSCRVFVTPYVTARHIISGVHMFIWIYSVRLTHLLVGFQLETIRTHFTTIIAFNFNTSVFAIVSLPRVCLVKVGVAIATTVPFATTVAAVGASSWWPATADYAAAGGGGGGWAAICHHITLYVCITLYLACEREKRKGID